MLFSLTVFVSHTITVGLLDWFKCRHKTVVYKFHLASVDFVIVIITVILNLANNQDSLSYFSSSNCMQQIIESVNYCHQNNIVHRDLKVSSNVFAVYHCTQHSLSLVTRVPHLLGFWILCYVLWTSIFLKAFIPFDSINFYLISKLPIKSFSVLFYGGVYTYFLS